MGRAGEVCRPKSAGQLNTSSLAALASPLLRLPSPCRRAPAPNQPPLPPPPAPHLHPRRSPRTTPYRASPPSRCGATCAAVRTGSGLQLHCGPLTCRVPPCAPAAPPLVWPPDHTRRRCLAGGVTGRVSVPSPETLRVELQWGEPHGGTGEDGEGGGAQRGPPRGTASLADWRPRRAGSRPLHHAHAHSPAGLTSPPPPPPPNPPVFSMPSPNEMVIDQVTRAKGPDGREREVRAGGALCEGWGNPRAAAPRRRGVDRVWR
jgi:hypothetical protein